MRRKIFLEENDKVELVFGHRRTDRNGRISPVSFGNIKYLQLMACRLRFDMVVL